MTNYRILFVEDDSDTREVVRLLLALHNFEVTLTDRAEDALALARTERFDALLVDNWMPHMTGVELCKAVRKFDQRTPIIFYSGAVHESDAAEAELAGANCYLAKPCDPENLIETLVRLIESRTAIASA